MIDYTFIKSKRKSIGITVKSDGSVVVRAPLSCTKKRAEEFVLEKQAWIRKAQEKMAERRQKAGIGEDGNVTKPNPFTQNEIDKMKKAARQVLPVMTAELAEIIGVTYNNISIRMQKSRWGSCSAKGNLNFNCLLMLLPENIQRYVVVHELCHRKEMNHSRNFWNEVEKYQLTYREDRKQLKQLGSGLLMRLPE